MHCAAEDCWKPTLADFLLAALAALLKLVHSIEHHQDLHSAHSVEHMCIVSRSSPKPAGVVHTRDDKVDDLAPGQGIGPAEQVQSVQAPIQTVESQVLCEPVLILILALRPRSAIRACRLRLWHVQCQGSGCMRRAARHTARAQPADLSRWSRHAPDLTRATC